jgi:hypothetical protein
MDNDSGWAAQAITLTASEDDGQQAKLTLPCRWIELAQVWDGQAGSYFLVSGVEAGSLTNMPWAFLSFTDGSGKAHRYPVHAAQQIGPQTIRLIRGG